MNSETDLIAFENNYEKFILDYAKVAQTTNCELFCTGTELNVFVVLRPNFWNQLIKKMALV